MLIDRLKNYSFAYAPALLWGVLIFAFSAQPTLPGPDIYSVDFLFKKMAHITVYAVLYLLLYFGVARTTPATNHSRKVWLPLLICFVYAATDEFHQSLVPNRTPTLRDIGYDLLGASIAFLYRYRYI
jgi:VanZ family protein